MSPIYDQIRKARKVGTPLIGINTSDPANTMSNLVSAFAQDLMNADPPVTDPFVAVRWNVVEGMQPLNEAGSAWLQMKLGPEDPPMVNPIDALTLAAQLPEYGAFFVQGAQRVFDTDQASPQAVWNLRDSFKQNLRTLVLLAPQLTLPTELKAGEVQVFDEPLPTPDQLQEVVKNSYLSKDIKAPTAEQLDKITSQLMGLPAFAAEQVTMMSLGDKDIDMDQLIERRCQGIDQYQGMKVYRGKEKFSDIGGLMAVKAELQMLIHGKKSPRLIVNIEEIDKVFGAAGTESSGVLADQLAMLLSAMQNNEWVGGVGIGHPGTGKSLMGKALGNEAGVYTVDFDLGGMQNSLVGQSQQTIRENIKVLEALGGDRVFFWATANNISNLPTALKRRFRIGTFFFDLPTPEERESIWKYYLKKYQLKDSRPNDEGWTGAEIWQCCDKAWRYGKTPAEVAHSIVPISISDHDGVEKLRREASGRYLSASYEGTYQFTPGAPEVKKVSASKTIN